ncbi:peptidoglycan-binding protein [Streptomyces sp. NPDC005551]|uniref:peptidoglycan-binding protein n=1 Tax=Streptomyces sp. NPDC005551 TaxID=3364725 RepID=UPI0036A6AF7F
MKVIRSRWYGEGRSVPIRLVVIHDMEAPEKSTTAEAVAQYFANLPTTSKSSAHVCVDNDSAVRCVDDNDRAWHAPGANSDGLGLEMAGYARQTRAEWLDAYSKAVIDQAAKVTADWCTKYSIPVKHLTVAELKAGHKGIVGHRDVSAAYHQTDHTDPGPNFPWDYFLERVNHFKTGGTTTPSTGSGSATIPAFPGTQHFKAGASNKYVTRLGQQLVRKGFGRYYTVGPGPDWGEADRKNVAAFQKSRQELAGDADGYPGPLTWRLLFS